jgi:hypothetical protein
MYYINCYLFPQKIEYNLIISGLYCYIVTEFYLAGFNTTCVYKNTWEKCCLELTISQDFGLSATDLFLFTFLFAWQLFDSVLQYFNVTGFVWTSHLIEVIELIKYWIMNVEGVCTWSKNRLFTSKHCQWRSGVGHWGAIPTVHVASYMYTWSF